MSIFKDYHDSTMAGHPNCNKMSKSVQILYMWPGIKNEVEACISGCEIYGRTKPQITLTEGLFKSFLIAEGPWKSAFIVYILELPASSGFNLY